MTVKSLICEPANCIVFVIDAAGGEVAEYVRGVPVFGTDSAISVCCQAPVDGQTRVTIGLDREVDPGTPPVHDQMLATPKHLVRVETAGDVLLEHPVSRNRTRVRIWTNHPMWADDIIIGLS